MTLAAGTRLGAYEIVAPIGAGGMGEVFRARDTRLGRDVAIKALPDAFARDPQRVARFQREAQILASLNHPHIAGIYGLEETGDAKYLVLEFIDGESLAEILSGTRHLALGTRTPVEFDSPQRVPSAERRVPSTGLPLSDALPIARQILDALAAAHEKGIVHRDLKPANIMVQGAWGPTPTRGEDGRLAPTRSTADVSDCIVKVLDFGLARVVESEATSDSVNSPTLTAMATEVGMILGTAAYMAPEQVKGRTADKRCDIWAFGCVLYEILTGTRAFAGDDASDTMATVLKGEPDWPALPADVPPGVTDVLRRCLEKDRKARIPEIAAVRYLLDDAVAAKTAPATPPAQALAASRTRERVWMAAAAVFALAAIGVGAWTYLRPAPAPQIVQFTIPEAEKNPFQGCCAMLSLSPDGRHLAYAASADGTQRLWVRDLDSSTARLLPGTEGASSPFWSPDNRFVAFLASSKLRRADVTGGTPITLADFATGTDAWSSAGVILFTGRDSRLYRIPSAGGQPVAVTELDKNRNETGHWWPTFLPDGRRFIFQALSSDASKNALFLGSLDSSSRKHLLDATSFVAYAQGHLFYQRDGTLVTQPFDEKAGRLTGDAAPLIEDIAYNPANGRAIFSVSATGAMAYRTGGSLSATQTLTWFDRQGKRVGTTGEPGRLSVYFRLSPDGRSVAFSRADSTGQYDIWTIDLSRNVATRLTSDAGFDDTPVWSADGTQVIFRSNRKDRFDLYRRAAGGGGADELLFESAEDKWPMSVSRDGRLLLFTRDMRAQQGYDIWALPLTRDGKPFSVIATQFLEISPALSPDGHWIAYQSNESGPWQVYIQPFPPTGPRVRVSTTTGQDPVWSADGKQLYYNSIDKHLNVVDVASPLHPGLPKELFGHNAGYKFQPLGDRFLFIAGQEGAAAPPITVIVNFTAGLKR